MTLLTREMLLQTKVVILGDIILDRYVRGDARRLSPEAPIPILRPTRSHAVIGGAANVCANIVSLGASATLIGVIGDDGAGWDVRSILAGTFPQVASGLVAVRGRPTTVKTRYIAGNHQLLRLDEETTNPIDEDTSEALLDRFSAALPLCQVVVLSDYAKGVLTPALVRRAISMAREAGVLIVVDPKHPDFGVYAGADFITPNELEIERATGTHIDSNEAAELAGHSVRVTAAVGSVLLTRSCRGLTLASHDGTSMHEPAIVRAVADVSGAGDTLVAAFAVMLAASFTPEQAAQIANLAAGVAVAKPGTATVSFDELETARHTRNASTLDRVRVDLKSAIDLVAVWQSAGMRVGFTNGCFDLIHPGHVTLLAKARSNCDRLVVGLNTDASIKRLKGSDRPIQCQTARAIVLASLAAVDLIVLFDDDTPRQVIAKLAPDILFKGADYSHDQVVGGDLVEARGGMVMLIDLEEGFSTTRLVEKMSRAGSVKLPR